MACGISGPDTPAPANLRISEAAYSNYRTQVSVLRSRICLEDLRVTAGLDCIGVGRSNREARRSPASPRLCARRRGGRATGPTACLPDQSRHAVADSRQAYRRRHQSQRFLGWTTGRSCPSLRLRNRWNDRGRWRCYGSILAEVEYTAIMDFLPDRQAKTFASWLWQGAHSLDQLNQPQVPILPLLIQATEFRSG